MSLRRTVGVLVLATAMAGCGGDDGVEGDGGGDPAACGPTSTAVAASPGGPGGSGLPGQNMDETSGGAGADTIPPDADTDPRSTDQGANATTTTCP